MCHKHESFALNARDCEHGRQIGKCPECELAETLDELKELDGLKSELSDAKAEIARLTDQIKRSGLIEVDGCRAEGDGCSGVVLRNSGKILVPAGQLAQVEQQTKDLQKMANMAREIAKLTECVVAADELRNYMGEGYALVAKYDEARKDVKI